MMTVDILPGSGTGEGKLVGRSPDDFTVLVMQGLGPLREVTFLKRPSVWYSGRSP